MGENVCVNWCNISIVELFILRLCKCACLLAFFCFFGFIYSSVISHKQVGKLSKAMLPCAQLHLNMVNLGLQKGLFCWPFSCPKSFKSILLIFMQHAATYILYCHKPRFTVYMFTFSAFCIYIGPVPFVFIVRTTFFLRHLMSLSFSHAGVDFDVAK